METQGEIYHSYYQEPQESERRRLSKRFSKVFGKISFWSMILGVILIFIQFAPSLWFSFSKGIDELARAISMIGKPSQPPSKIADDYLPRFDPKLPMENRVKITSIGVDTQIFESTVENYESALKKGVWRVPDFGTPELRQYPTILAAHRYGYLAWTNIYRRKNSFFNLPKLQIGDTVEIIWKQRKYIFEIYAEDKGEKISDYSANLILYTCENLGSSERIFKYARLLHI